MEDITIIKQKVSKALSLSEMLAINDAKGLAGAIDFLQKIKLTGKVIKNAKEKITKPLNAALKEARDLFRPAENDYLQAEKNVKQKILDYNIAEEKKREEQERKLAERVEKGTLKMDTAVKKIEEMPGVSQQGKTGKVSMRTIQKVVINNEAKLPRKYLIPNETLIRKDALAGVEIPGVEIVEEKLLASL